MIRTLNGYGNQININTITAGDAITLGTLSTSQSVNVDISKQTAKTSIADDDLFILEDGSGAILKITGANLKTVIDANFFVLNSPNIYPKQTSENLLLGTTTNLNSRKLLIDGTFEVTGNSYLNTVSQGTWNGTRLTKDYVPTDTVYDADLLTAVAFATGISSNYIFGRGGKGYDFTNYNSIRGYEIEIGDIPQDTTPPYSDTSSKGSSRIDIQARTGSDDNTINLLCSPVWNQGINSTINLTATSRN